MNSQKQNPKIESQRSDSFNFFIRKCERIQQKGTATVSFFVFLALIDSQILGAGKIKQLVLKTILGIDDSFWR